MNRHRKFATFAVLLAAGLFWPACAMAEDGDAGTALGQEWVAIDLERLDALRGGFDLPGGMQLSFGIERVVFVNGELVASTRVVVGDVARMNAEQAQALQALQAGAVVQVGDGNRAAAVPGNALVIQNALDGQDIRAMTTINVGVDTLGAFQNLNLQQALQDAQTLVPGTP